MTGNAGDSETDTVTASGQDDDGNAVSDDDDAVVEIDDVASAMHVVKTAGTAADGEIFHINEPGGTVTFYVTVYNDSTVDSITIDTLTDDVHGDLDTRGRSDLHIDEPGGTVTFTVTVYNDSTV